MSLAARRAEHILRRNDSSSSRPFWGGRSYDELAAIGGMLIGASEQVAAQVETEAIGVDTLLLVCSFGTWRMCRSAARLSSSPGDDPPRQRWRRQSPDERQVRSPLSSK